MINQSKLQLLQGRYHSSIRKGKEGGFFFGVEERGQGTKKCLNVNES